jgi:hypothetical protein
MRVHQAIWLAVGLAFVTAQSSSANTSKSILGDVPSERLVLGSAVGQKISLCVPRGIGLPDRTYPTTVVMLLVMRDDGSVYFDRYVTSFPAANREWAQITIEVYGSQSAWDGALARTMQRPSRVSIAGFQVAFRPGQYESFAGMISTDLPLHVQIETPINFHDRSPEFVASQVIKHLRTIINIKECR